MRQARILAHAAQSLLIEERTGLQQEKVAVIEARQRLHGLEEQIGAARKTVLGRTRELAFDLRRIAGMRDTLGLDDHPEFDALIARYAQAGLMNGREIGASQ